MLTLKNGFYVCRNKNQIPVVYDIHAFYNLEDQHFKIEDGYNGIEIFSCLENKNN